MLSICAVIAARNEFDYLRVLLPTLAEQRIDVVLIDYESTDDSRLLHRDLLGQPLLRVEQRPYRGEFSLTEQLAAKRAVYASLNHDWVVHQDADEILEHRLPEKTLRDAIEQADADGFNAINFDEFVFLPDQGADHRGRDYRREVRRYYFFEPYPLRLNRAWQRRRSFDPGASGGHVLAGDGLLLSPSSHVLRHYIVLGEEHAQRKYVDRRFSPDDLRRGWHHNRRNISPEALLLPERAEVLLELPSWKAALRKDRPVTRHYWEW